MNTINRLATILVAVPLLTSCAEALKSDLLMDPIKDAAQLITVIPAQKIAYASTGILTDGRSLNPVLSKSLRTFDTVTVNFPDDTVETLHGIGDYNIFAWRKAGRYLGEGELECDIAPSEVPVVDLETLLKVGNVVLWFGTMAATFAPTRDRTLITKYDSSRDNRIRSLEFRPGRVTNCD